MSQDHTQLDDDDLEHEEPDESGLPALRRKAKAGDRAISENLDLHKQLAFLKAGIDPDSSKIAKGFYETWKGDVTDIAALKAEAVEWGLLKDGDKPTPTEEEVVSPERAAEDARRAAVQDVLTGGRPGGTEAPTPHPRHAAMEKYHTDVRAGKDPKAAAVEAFQQVLGAASQGDRRVFFDREQHMRDAAEADRIAGRPPGAFV